jgi:hypothetical protein
VIEAFDAHVTAERRLHNLSRGFRARVVHDEHAIGKVERSADHIDD